MSAPLIILGSGEISTVQSMAIFQIDTFLFSRGAAVRLAWRSFAVMFFVLGIAASQFVADRAAATDTGIALQELDIAPVTSRRQLIDLGCRDVKKITKRVRPFKEEKESERTIRYYEYRGLNLITESAQREEALVSTIPASALATWGLSSGENVSLSDIERQFGKPTEVEDDAALYTSQHDERTIVFVRLSGSAVRQFDWSCN